MANALYGRNHLSLIVVLRYAFDIGSIPLQESVMYMHGALFMLGIGIYAQARRTRQG